MKQTPQLQLICRNKGRLLKLIKDLLVVKVHDVLDIFRTIGIQLNAAHGSNLVLVHVFSNLGIARYHEQAKHRTLS